MRTLSYVCAATGETIGFEGPLYGETLTGLRARMWDYSLASRGMSGITRKTRDATVTVRVHDSPDTLDLLRRLADADMASGTAGALVADGEWETRAWIAKSEPQTVTPTMVETQLTIVLVDGVWRRETLTHFTPRTDASSTDLDHPYDYPHDYAGMPLGVRLANDTGAPQPVRITIFGPATHPYVVIGPNRYEVDVTVPSGSRLEINGVGEVKTVALVDQFGNTTNAFDKAVRGSGKDSGTYIFQPVPIGESVVSWTGGFQFDLTTSDERGEPPWT